MLTKSFSKTKPVCKVTFTLPIEAAKGGKDVRVLGDFNNWSWEKGAKMKAGKEAFSTALELEAGKSYQFRYLIDNHVWENDWAADDYATAALGMTNSVVNVEAEKAAAKPVAAKKATEMKATAKPAAKKTATNAKAASDVAAPAAKPAVAKTAAKPAAKKVAAKPAAKKVAAKPAAKKAAATTPIAKNSKTTK